MTLNYQALKAWPFRDIEQRWTKEMTMLYALSVGLGTDPNDEDQIAYVYEENLKVLPSMASVISYPGQYLKNPDTGVDWKQVLHGEQNVTLHKPVPPEGIFVARTVIDEIVDKGAGKGALIYSHRDLYNKGTGDLLCTIGMTIFCRADGGFGGPSGPVKTVHALPDRAPDLAYDLSTLPQSALLYRLNGDWNPLHASPAIAKAAGFPRCILHGMCTYGVAGHALVRMLCDYESSRVKRFDVRFAAPVYPGETIRTEIWREGAGVAGFRCRAIERDLVVLNNGLLEYFE